MGSLFYELNDFVDLRRRDDFSFILDRTSTASLPLHPSEALVLSLLDGEISYEELIIIISIVYNISEKEAKEHIDWILGKARIFLHINKDKKSSNNKFNPKKFIYCPKNENFDVSKPLDVPFALNLVLTKRCNFKCRYCYHGSCPTNFQDLDSKIAYRILDEAAEMGVVLIGLSGGEPFLYKEICDIISFITNRNMIPLISTNGSLINDKLVDKLAMAGLESIQVSLDTSSPEVHDFLTNTRNTFDSVISSIRIMKSHKIRVRVKSVITQYNILGVEELIDFLAYENVDEINISLEEAGSCETKKYSNMTPLVASEIARLRDCIKTKTDQYNDCIIKFSDNNEKWLNQKDIIRCGNLFTSMVIHPSGNVSVCEMIDNPELTYGNVKKSNLRAIWLGESHRYLLNRIADRKQLDENCSNCKLLKHCNTGCFNLSKLLNDNFFYKDPRCPGSTIADQS